MVENHLQLFNFENQQVRTLTINEEPYFVGKDIATILGYKNTKDALLKHVDEEDKLGAQIATSGQRREMTIINESGLYSLILSSKLPNAKKFKRWVTSEVLPTIRKTGSYQLPQTPEGQIRLLLKSNVHMDERLTNAEEDIALLKNKSEIDSTQRFQLQKARNKRAIEVCGGKDSNFYKTRSRKVFMALAHDFKEFFQIPRYDALRKEDFDKAIEFINGWYPSVLLKREIDQVNAQTDLDI
ncbi:toxin Bro [Lactobacillus johnsonii 16]|uniref:BRO family protein n=1 Tax=Lactobacillus johnsonii TaxID=33959 RepID=UPI0006C46FCD|nr:BRO family protein [Lactobacillus johnsonii]KOH01648.1 toxin Bro [Lactobacillus johnsonii 16]